MIKFLSNIPIFRRLFIAFAIAAVIPVVVIVLLSNFYLSSLNTRGQAVQTSFDAQSIAAQQQNNLASMNASLQARHYQIFASLSNVIKDPSLLASGELINGDILARQANFEQTLESYIYNYELATSANMSTILNILLNDNPNIGPTIINDQQRALNAVNGTNGLWAQYRNLQDQALTKLQALENHPPESITMLNNEYNATYLTLWQANKQFIDLRNTWQIVVDSAASMGKTVSKVGPSQTSPVYLTIVFTCIILLIYASVWGFTIFQFRRSFSLYGEGKNSGNTPIPPSGSIPPVPQLP